jgi:hypothetical protein
VRLDAVRGVPQNHRMVGLPSPPASDRLLPDPDAHERAVREWADQQTDHRERTRAAGQLEMIRELRAAILAADLGRASSFVDLRSLAYNVVAYESLFRFAETLRQAWLEGRPDAGFGH